MDNLSLRLEILEYLCIREMAMLAQTDRAWQVSVATWIRIRHYHITGCRTGGSLLHQYPKSWRFCSAQGSPSRYWEILSIGDDNDGRNNRDNNDRNDIDWCDTKMQWVIYPDRNAESERLYLDIPSFMRKLSHYRFLRPYMTIRKSMMERIIHYFYNWCLPTYRDYGDEPVPSIKRGAWKSPEFIWVYEGGHRNYMYFEVTFVGDLADDFDDHTLSIGWTDRAALPSQPLLTWNPDDGSLWSRERDYEDTASRFFINGDTAGMGYIPSSHEIFLTRNGQFIIQFEAPWSAVQTCLYPVVITNSRRTILFNPGTSPFVFHD